MFKSSVSANIGRDNEDVARVRAQRAVMDFILLRYQIFRLGTTEAGEEDLTREVVCRGCGETSSRGKVGNWWTYICFHSGNFECCMISVLSLVHGICQ